jgi:hypothetical protein
MYKGCAKDARRISSQSSGWPQRDHKGRAIYFKGHNNQSYRKIDLAQIEFGKPLASAILADPLPTDPIYFHYQFGQDVTEMLNQ